METIEAQILKVEKQIEECGDPEERKQLRKEKEQLRKEKEQLREKELILLRRETGIRVLSIHFLTINSLIYFLSLFHRIISCDGSILIALDYSCGSR